MAALLDPDRALEMVLEHVPAGGTVELPLAEALGRTLAEPLLASCDQPPFAKAMMDGFAVCVGDAGAEVAVGGEVAAGSDVAAQVSPGVAVEIMTGAPVPPGTEAVVKVEDTERNGDRVRLPAEIRPEQHTQAQGGFCVTGQEILPAGTPLSSVAVAGVASMGQPTVRVAQVPSVAIITTGDELGKPGGAIGGAQIYDSNGPMLMGQARLAGAREIRRLHARDTLEALAEALAEAADVDVVVLTGGVSMGRYDLVPRAVEAAGGEHVFHKVAQKPGKPILFARRGDQLIFGLPGTPLGSHFGFHRFVSVAIRKLMGLSPVRERRVATLTADLTVHGNRTLFRLARAFRDCDQWRVDPLEWRGSSDLFGPALSNCYLRFPPCEMRLESGDEVSFELIDGVDA